MSGSAGDRRGDHVPREPFEASVRLRGAAIWAAYGAVEALFAVMLPRALFPSTFIPPDDRYTLFLLVLYPLAGALLGGMSMVGLAIAFAANAIAVITGPALAVPVASAAIAVVMLRNRPWLASLLLVAPLSLAREIGVSYTFRTKVLLAGAAMIAVLLLRIVSAKVRWSLKPVATMAIFVLTMVGAMFINVPPPRDVAPDQPPPRAASPSIVLIVMDTVRADHLSVYHYGRNTTPNLAQFARTATLYGRAYAPANMTLPSHASLFTGLYGSEHTAHYDEGWAAGRPLPARAVTAAELLSARGYATASIAANGYLGEAFGLDQGFQHLDVRPPWMAYGMAANFYLRSRVAALVSRVIELPRRTHLLSRGGEEISDLAIAYLNRMAGKRRPFFLVLNYLDAHHPYIPPAPYDTMFPGYDATQPPDLENRLIAAFTQGAPKITPRERAHLISQYDGSIAFEDHQIARVLAALRQRGAYDRTLIIVLSDHGESFGEHGILTHGLANYDSETHVPLIVKNPGQTEGVVVAEPVSLLHVWPLLSSMPQTTSAIITESFPLRGPGATLPSRRPGTAKIEGTLKTIVNVNGIVESYDVAADPGEMRNLAPSADSRRMAEEIATWRRSLRGIDAAAPSRAIDPELLRRLRALGYVR
ncbi:MAG: sulfatase [Thermoanaerobaculia bacterium]